MGFREDLITNWKDKTIEYQERKFYILEQFVYEGKEYLYGCDIDTIGNEKMNVVFLYKIKDSLFEHIEDEKLFEELLIHVTGILTGELMIDTYENNKELLDKTFNNNQ